MIELLSEHGLTMLVCSSLLLAVGCGAVICHREPAHRKHLGELCAWGTLVYVVLVFAPIPRVLDLRQPAPVERQSWASSEPGEREERSGSVAGVALRGVENPREDTTGPESVALTIPADAPVGDRLSLDAWSGSAASRTTVVVAGLYLVGAALCAIWLLAGFVHLALILFRARPAPSWLRELLPEAERERILVTPYRTRPFCLRGLGGRILLSEGLARKDRSRQLRQVLLHELGHLRQTGAGGRLVWVLLFPVLFWNPLFWWLRGRVRMDAELLADDWAARRSSPTEYARQLIALAGEDLRHRAAPLGAPGVLGTTSEFYRRIKMLLEREGNLSHRCSHRRNVLQAGITALAVTAVASLGGVTAQEPEAARRNLELRVDALLAENSMLRDEIAKLRAALDGDPVPGPATREVLQQGLDAPLDVRRWLWAAPPQDEPRIVPAWRGMTLAALDPHTLGRILQLNPGVDPTRIRVGQEILFPGDMAGHDFDPLILGLPAERVEPVPQEAAPREAADRPGPIVDGATLRLMFDLIELREKIRDASKEVEHLEVLAERDFVTAESVERARRDLDTARRKEGLIDALVHAEMRVTERELELWTAAGVEGTPEHREARGRAQRLAERLDILRSVLESGR